MNAAAIKKQKQVILTMLFITWIINYLDKLSMNTAIIPITAEFNLNEAQSGLIISSFFVSYAIMQIIGGFLSDKYGARKIILISVLFWSLFTIATGLAWSFVSLLIIRFLFGLGEGSFPAANALALADYFPKNERGRAKSITTAATTIGSVLATIFAALIIEHLGWHSLFFIFGILGILLTIALHYVLTPPLQNNNEDADSSTAQVSVKEILKKPMLWQLMSMYFGVSIVNWGLTSWMPTYMVNVKNLDIINMGFLAIFPAITAFFAVLLVGRLLDKLSAGKEKYLIILGATIAGLSLFAMTNVSSVALVVLCQSLTLGGCLFATTAILTLPLKYFSHNSIGRATGFMNFGGQIAGAISPTVMGFMIHLFNGSYQAAFTFLMIMVILPIIVAITLKAKQQ